MKKMLKYSVAVLLCVLLVGLACFFIQSPPPSSLFNHAENFRVVACFTTPATNAHQAFTGNKLYVIRNEKNELFFLCSNHAFEPNQVINGLANYRRNQRVIEDPEIIEWLMDRSDIRPAKWCQAWEQANRNNFAKQSPFSD